MTRPDLLDLSNCALLYIHDEQKTATEAYRKYRARLAAKLASAIADMGGVKTEGQQEAVSRLMAGKGASHV